MNQTQKNCLVVHGCPGDEESLMDLSERTYTKHWIPWIRRELNARGIHTQVPLLPEPWAPDYNKFKAEFEKYPVNESTILIGHSCGGAFLVRWLGDTKQKIDTLILVAPWKISDEGDEARDRYYTYPIDESIKDRIGRIVMFTSDDEEEDGKKSVQIFHKALGGKLIELKGKGHFTSESMGGEAFPELLREIV
ncbi:alpha/beta hydrolase [Candidatus Uhrbacteria bacterium]|nr:alpha/beta hydrolase [Candidatus Uhrbacteria bacterium]